MSNKVILEEAIHKIEREIEADEAWINYIDGEVREQNDKYRSLSARFDEIEAKIDDLIRVVEREIGH